MNSFLNKICKIFTIGNAATLKASMQPFYSQEYFGHLITLHYKGEIRFGPAYFELFIDNVKLSMKIFGMNIWILDEYLFCGEEWLTTSELDGPLTRLVLFNLKEMKCSTMRNMKGFPELVRMESFNLIYTRREKNWTKEVEININEIANWNSIHSSEW